MRKLRTLALVTTCALFVAGCGQKIDVRQLQQNNGLYYKIGDNDPFSGTVTNVPVSEFARVSANGSCTVSMKSGVVDGAVTCATENGKQLYEANWREGKRDGTEKVWFPETGQLVSIGEWKNGRKDGLEQRFNPFANKLISETHWSDNRKEGQERRWDVKGEVLLVDLDWIDGKQTGFSKIGMWEENFKDGQRDGVRKFYDVLPNAGKVTGEAVNAILLAEQTVAQLGGGASSYSMVPGTYVRSEEHWSAGKKISAVDFPPSRNAEQAIARDESCVDQWITAFRKENGSEAMISSDQMAEWDEWCKSGKKPD